MAAKFLLEDGVSYLLAENSDFLRREETFFDDARQAILTGLDSAQAEGTGWDAVVKAGEVVTAVVRTSDTVVTITLSAAATYNITAQETITATIPASAVLGAASVVAAPTFTIDFVGGGVTAGVYMTLLGAGA